MFNRLYKLLSEPKRVVSMATVVMVVCILLLAAFYYDLGSTGGTFAALGCALFITAVFAPIPRGLKISLETVAAAGLIRGGVMLGLSPGDTLFLTCALAFIVGLNWIDQDPPSDDETKQKSGATRDVQKPTDTQVRTHHTTADC